MNIHVLHSNIQLRPGKIQPSTCSINFLLRHPKSTMQTNNPRTLLDMIQNSILFLTSMGYPNLYTQLSIKHVKKYPGVLSAETHYS